MGDFGAKMRELGNLVGRGKITAKVTVDQIYARRQHETADYAHPGGGQAFFLHDALENTAKEQIEKVADEVLKGDVQASFISYANKLAEESSRLTPVELGNLRRSAAVSVLVGGAAIYRRPADVPRIPASVLNRRHRHRRP